MTVSVFGQMTAVAVIGAVLAIMLKKDAPTLSFCVSVAAGIILLTAGVRAVGGAVKELETILYRAGLERDLYLPVARVVAIAVLVRVASAICRDAGQTALGVKLELAGTGAAAVCCIPLFHQVLTLASGLLE